MKNKLLLCCVILLVTITAYAGGGDKKDEPNVIGNVTFTASGKPIKEVSIIAYNTLKKEKIVVSDVNGNFSFIDLKPGIYKFIFQKDGFQKVIREKIILKAKEDYELHIHMSEEEFVFDLMPSPLRFSGVE